MENWFEELSSSHKEWIELTRKIGFEKGIRQSTVEKYPDPVHFIYELLQNAEDQDATEAEFVLFAHRLVFRHNGKPFTRSNVESITSIGNSDKTGDANKIGRFGIGFKSVFAITDRPEIYTLLENKRFAFAIEDLVVPVALSEDDAQSQHGDTQFIFPFIKGQEKELYSKIRERLSTLGFEALLFLQHLTSIEWQAGTDHGIYVHEVKGEQHELVGESVEDGQHRQSSARYLMFTRNVRLKEENERKLDVRIAFRLDEKGSIIAEPNQKLAVYFPTEQTTGLNFRLHGPFLLTDNRANIKSKNDTNTLLIQECAILLGESMQRIREAGLLTVDFLSLLPIRKEAIQPPFTPLYDHVLQVLKEHSLLPTADGIFARATEVKLARGGDLRDLINDQQLSDLYGAVSPLYWLSPKITENRERDLYHYLTESLDVDVVDPAIFVEELEQSFLEKQTDTWLIKLYQFLSKQPALKNIIKEKPILRLEDGSQVSPFPEYWIYSRNKMPNAYLPPKGGSKFPLVKRSLTEDTVAYDFLKGLGLSEPDIVDEVIKFVLPAYEAGAVAIDDEPRNKQDLQLIQEALERNNHPARSQLLSQLHKTPFIRAINAKTSEQAWKTPHGVYSKTEELSIWFDGNEEAWFIISPFHKSLLSDLGIPTDLQPRADKKEESTGYVITRNSRGHHQRGLHGFDPYAKLDGLKYVLEHITLERAKLLWNFLLKHRHLIKGVVETSTHQTFDKSRSEERFSKIGQLCSKNVWLPDKEGEFHAPNEMFLTDLAEGFETSTLEAQEVAQRLGMRKAEELQLADTWPIKPDDIFLIQNDPEAFRIWCDEQRNKPSLPSSITSDPERRKEKAAEAAYAAEEKTYKAVTINRRITADNNEVKSYLRDLNTNEEGQLICQLCDQPMPFRLPTGEEYFVACQYINIFEKEYRANHLALCPNCAAEFMNACQTDENKKEELILAMNATTNEENLIVHIDTPIHQHLRFTQRHLIDLQAAIQEEKQRRMEEQLTSS